MGEPTSNALVNSPKKKTKFIKFLRKNKVIQNKQLYFMLLPVLAFYAIFCYTPMYGILLAFKKYNARLGIAGSPWAGFDHFARFFSSPYFSRLLGNTIRLSGLQLLFTFPIPIILALMVNELRSAHAKKLVQNITYIPHFLSTVVLVGMLMSFLDPSTGIVNTFIRVLGGEGKNFIQEASWFRPLYIISSVWQGTGWNSIIFIAALAGVDPQMHEAATIEGASRLQRLWYINLPAIAPTIVIVLILNVGQIMNIGFEKAFLMQNDLNRINSDIISTYVYQMGIVGAQFDYSTAIGLFNSVINCTLLFVVNGISRKVGETSLW